MIFVAIKNNVAEIVKLKLTRGIKPSLPGYRFIGSFQTKTEAVNSIPVGVEYNGKIIGKNKDADIVKNLTTKRKQ